MSYSNYFEGIFPIGVFFLTAVPDNDATDDEWFVALRQEECRKKMLQPVVCNGYVLGISETNLYELASFHDPDSIGQNGARGLVAAGNYPDPMVHGC